MNRQKLRLGFTLAEALVMVIIVGSCMVPIIGTLQTGAKRTEDMGHKNRMRIICETKLNEIIASGAFLKLPIDIGTYTIPWPSSDPVATYIVQVMLDDPTAIGMLASPSADSLGLTGLQPASLKGIVVSVALQNESPDEATETVKLATLIGIPVSTNPGNIYVSDPKTIRIYSLDAEAYSLTESFTPPNWSNAVALNATNDEIRPANMAVHPNNKWLAIQRKEDIAILEIDKNSPTRGRFISVFPKQVINKYFLEGANDSEKIRKDRGIVFRSDGRYCIVTSHDLKQVYILNVPKNLPASFTLLQSFTLGSDKYTDLIAGEDGYAYLAEQDYATGSYKCFRRLNMQSLSNPTLEDYILYGSTSWDKPFAVSTTRDGRWVVGLYKTGPVTGPCITWSSSSDYNATWTASQLYDYPSGVPGDGDLQDIQVTLDNKWAVLPSKKGSGDSRVYAVRLPPVSATLNPFSIAVGNNGVANPDPNVAVSEKTNLVVVSPYGKDVVVDRMNNGQCYILDVASLGANVYVNGIPADRQISFSNLASGALDAAHIAARVPEEILIGCSNNSTHRIETLDLYPEMLRNDRIIPLSAKPNDISLNSAGERAVFAPYVTNYNFGIVDVFGKVFAKNGYGVANSAPLKAAYLLDGSYIGTYIPSGSPSDYIGYGIISSDEVTTKYEERLIFPARVTDVIPLNNGGALVLVASGTTESTAYSEIHWIASNSQVFARWNSLYDNFPPRGVTRMAVSADDSLLALYDPNGTAASVDYVYYYDFNSQNFASLTQQMGLIVMNHKGDKESLAFKDFSTPLFRPSVFNASGCLTADYVTTGHNYPVSTKNYPINSDGHFHVFGTCNGDFQGHNVRWFGYFYPPASITRCGWINDDYSRFFIDGTVFSIREQNSEDRWVNNPIGTNEYNSCVISYPSPQSHSFQFETSGDTAAGYSGQFGFSFTNTLGAADGINNSPYTVKTGGSLWSALASASCRPFRFHPQFIGQYGTGADSPTGDVGEIVFSRDVASPTLFFLDRGTKKLHYIPFGASAVTRTLPSTSYKDMAVSPDGNRLILAADNPNRLEIVDLSLPATSTYRTTIATVTLSFPPICLAARPFNRHWSKRNTYEQVATMPYVIAGQSLAALATGGIYLAGGGQDNISIQSPPATQTISLFSPLNQNFSIIGELATPTKGHNLVSYDDELLAFNGYDGTATKAYVQQWNPTTKTCLTSPDNLSTQLTATHSAYNAPFPNVVSNDGSNEAGEEAWRAFDGNTATPWHNGTVIGGWLKYDFRTPKIVNEIQYLTWQSDGSTPDSTYGPPDFALQASHNDSWTSLGTDYWQLTTGGWARSASWQSFPFANSTGYRYYRFYVTWGPDTKLGIREMRFFGHQTHLSSTSSEIPTNYVARGLGAACQTPYGTVIGGGINTTVATSGAYVYYPHAIASPSPNMRMGFSQQLPQMPDSLSGHSFVWHKGFLYRVGGINNNNAISTTTHRFSFDTNSWTTINIDSPFRKIDAAACSFGDEIFLFGGTSPNRLGSALMSAAAWNPDTNIIRTITALPQTQNLASALANRGWAPCAVPCGPFIYIIGGTNAYSTSTQGREILKYTP